MNKRLLLSLYDRSGLGAYMPVDLKGHELEVEEHMEKFAELIVKECVKQCNVNFVGTVGSHPNAHNRGVKKCIDNIKDHFGVIE